MRRIPTRMQEMRLRMPGRALARAQPQMVNPLKKKDAVRPRIELKERGRDFLDDISAYGRSENGDRGDKMRTSGERERPQDRGDRRRPLGRGIAPRMGIGMDRGGSGGDDKKDRRKRGRSSSSHRGRKAVRLSWSFLRTGRKRRREKETQWWWPGE